MKMPHHALRFSALDWAILSLAPLGIASCAIALTSNTAQAQLSLQLWPIISATCLLLSALLYTRRYRRMADKMELVAQKLEALSNSSNDDFPTQSTSENLELRLENAMNSAASSVRERVDMLHAASQRDPLTHLYNRKFFQQLVEGLLHDSADDTLHALFFIDLDGFKQINDTLGHHIGDRLLLLVSDRLRTLEQTPPKILENMGNIENNPYYCPPSNVHISRFGGDEFVVFITDIASPEAADKMAHSLLDHLTEPYDLGNILEGVCEKIGASVGYSLCPTDGNTYNTLMRAADAAMYEAKRKGRNCVTHYTKSLYEASEAQARHAIELRHALSNGEFELYFQPLHDIKSRRIASAEALIRWNHPTRGMLMPNEFIQTAKKSKLLDTIDIWVIEEAVRCIAQFTALGHPIQISINISYALLERPDFPSIIAKALDRWHAPAEMLEVEIREGLAMRNPDLVSRQLKAINALGVSIAIDDFGTSFSKLSALIQLPIHRIKIDRSLLIDLTFNAKSRILVQSLINLINSLGFTGVAEGVESQAQADILSALGCSVVQGYYFSQPMSFLNMQNVLCQNIEAPVKHRQLRIAL